MRWFGCHLYETFWNHACDGSIFPPTTRTQREESTTSRRYLIGPQLHLPISCRSAQEDRSMRRWTRRHASRATSFFVSRTLLPCLCCCCSVFFILVMAHASDGAKYFSRENERERVCVFDVCNRIDRCHVSATLGKNKRYSEAKKKRIRMRRTNPVHHERVVFDNVGRAVSSKPFVRVFPTTTCSFFYILSFVPLSSRRKRKTKRSTCVRCTQSLTLLCMASKTNP